MNCGVGRKGQGRLQAGQLGQGSGKLEKGVRLPRSWGVCMWQGVPDIWMQGTDNIKVISWRPGPGGGEAAKWICPSSDQERASGTQSP